MEASPTFHSLLHCLLPLLLPDKKNWNPKLQSYHSCSKKSSATFLCFLLLTAPSPASSVSLTADTPLSSLPASLHHLLANVASLCCPPLLLIRLGEAPKTPRVAFKFSALFAWVRGCKSNHKRKSGGRGTAPVYSSLSHLCLCWDWGGKGVNATSNLRGCQLPTTRGLSTVQHPPPKTHHTEPSFPIRLGPVSSTSTLQLPW